MPCLHAACFGSTCNKNTVITLSGADYLIILYLFQTTNNLTRNNVLPILDLTIF